MSTILTALKQSSWLRAKYFLFAAIGLMLAYVIPHDESFLVHPKDPCGSTTNPLSGGCLRPPRVREYRRTTRCAG